MSTLVGSDRGLVGLTAESGVSRTLVGSDGDRIEVVEEHGVLVPPPVPGGGGGGSEIDDGAPDVAKVWSSQKVSTELEGKQGAALDLTDPDTGEPIGSVPLGQFVQGMYFAMLYSPIISHEIPGFSGNIERSIVIVDELPSFQTENTLYAVRDALTGILTWHLPNLVMDP